METFHFFLITALILFIQEHKNMHKNSDSLKDSEYELTKTLTFKT